MQFGQPVNSGGGAFHILLARSIIYLFSKHIVCADMDQKPVSSGHCRSQITDRKGIDTFGKFLIVFRSLYIGICCTVDDCVHIFSLHHTVYCSC